MASALLIRFLLFFTISGAFAGVLALPYLTLQQDEGTATTLVAAALPDN